jgi:hypothetical protein
MEKMVSQAETMAQLQQIQALKAARDRIDEVLWMMVPVVQELAAEGNSVARYLVEEFDKAQDTLKLTNLAAHTFLEDSNG